MKRSGLREAIEATQIEHLRFTRVLQTVAGRIDAALAGSEPKFQAIAGPSRVGKSALMAALKARYPETNIGNQRQLRVLFVDAPDAPSPKLLPITVLTALGVPIPPSRYRAGDLTGFMHEQLDEVKNVVLAFDEFSQYVEPGSRVSAVEVARWCKNVVLKGRTIVAAGVPRIEHLPDSDEQLQGRSYRTVLFDPYRPDDPEELGAHGSISLAYLDMLKKHGWRVQEDVYPILANMYLHAPGLGGGVCDFMRELARRLEGRKPGLLTIEDFADASATLAPLGPAVPAPFSSLEVTPTDLNKAYLHVVARNTPSKRKGT
jgi:hypothetical protein